MGPAARAATGSIGSNIVPSPKRKPAGTPASITAVDDESLVLLREMAADLKAIRRLMESDDSAVLPNHAVEPAPDKIDAKDLIGVKEAAGLAGVSDQTVYRWIDADLTRGRWAAGVWLVSKPRLLADLASGEFSKRKRKQLPAA